METQGLEAEAIREVERLTKKAEAPRLVHLQVPDGSGATVSIPLLVREDEVVTLTDELREAAKLAASLRSDDKAAPGWRSGVARHQSLQSFIDHLERFKSPASAVWADPAARKLVSVLDYHPSGAESEAAWGRHRGEYACPLSEAWVAWGGERGLTLSQDGFAELLDARDYDLTSGVFPRTEKEAPSPASLITLANNLEVYSTATAKRERDANTGRVRISFTEEKGVNGTVSPPTAFAIRIRIFEDSDPVLLEVRLRVTVEEGAAQFHIGIHGAREVLRAAFDQLCIKVGAETRVPVFSGSPE